MWESDIAKQKNTWGKNVDKYVKDFVRNYKTKLSRTNKSVNLYD